MIQGHGGHGGHCSHGGHGHGKERQLDFFCVGQLLQFVRCFISRVSIVICGNKIEGGTLGEDCT